MPEPLAYVNGNRERTDTLVVIFLRGGADGLNLLAPYNDDAYRRARPSLGLGEADVVKLDDRFGLNPHLAPLAPLYHDGHLAFLHAAGSEDDSRSHFYAQDWMEHGGAAAGGWLGRYLRYRPEPADQPLAAVALGRAVPEVLRGAPSAVAIDAFDAFSFGDDSTAYLNALGALYGEERDFLGAASRDTLRAVRALETLAKSTYTPDNGAQYGSDDFAAGLQRLAQLIKARVGMCTATLDLGGWDSHFAQATLINPLMDTLARGLAAFHRDLGPAMAHTTVVVMSEFGRRIYENASYGTDHGRGGLMFVLGGGIAGGRVHAPWTSLEETQFDGPGDLPVLTNYRDVLVPILARHGGIQDFSSVFPGYAISELPLFS